MTTQVALVTGASSGIGRDIARELAKKGFDLILVARREERLIELSQELQSQHGVGCLVKVCDLSNRAALNELMPSVVQWLKTEQRKLTVLVNNAGTGIFAPFDEQKAMGIQRDIDLNVLAPTTLTYEFIHIAKEHDQPSYILNVASLAALLATPNYAVYSSTKAYLHRFTEILRYELRKTHISATVLCPGGVVTEFFDHSEQEVRSDFGMMSSESVAKIGVDALLKRKFVVVPGLMNKLSAYARFLPGFIRLPAIAQTMSRVISQK